MTSKEALLVPKFVYICILFSSEKVHRVKSVLKWINYKWKRQRKIVMWGTLAGAHGVSVFVFLCLCAGVSAYLCDLVSVCLIVSGCVCLSVNCVYDRGR